MSSLGINMPFPDDVDYHADRRWQREQLALQSLSISHILAEVDSLIAAEPDEQRHPLFSLVANALDRRVMAGTGESLQVRYGKLIDQAIERLVEAKLADPTAWEDD
jgi:hypothetical protein